MINHGHFTKNIVYFFWKIKCAILEQLHYHLLVWVLCCESERTVCLRVEIEKRPVEDYPERK